MQLVALQYLLLPTLGMALTVDDLGVTHAELFKACPKWYDIGLALKVPVTTLDSIGGQFNNYSDKLREALKVWLKTATKPTWQDVVDILKSPVVGEPKLASDIKAKHCTTAEIGQASGQMMPEGQQSQLTTRATELHTLQQELQDSQELRNKDQQLQDSQKQIKELIQQVEEKQHVIEKRERQIRELQKTLIRRMRWLKDSKPPETMWRGSAAADSNMAYFNGYDSTTVHSYDSNTQEWHQLPATPHTDSTLVVVHHVLTTVGGQISGAATDSLLSLMGEGRGKKWLPNLPAMPTKRYWTAAVCSGCSLIVTGGTDGNNILATVEVLDTDTRQWSIANSLTHPFSWATISICGERLYMLGGYDKSGHGTRSVLSCSVPELLQSCQPQPLAGKLRTAPANQSTIWRCVADAPHYASSCATLCGQLVAVGGYEAGKNTSAITGYNETTDSWEAIGHMPTARRWALVAIFNGKMMVVGGLVGSYGTETDVVEILR